MITRTQGGGYCIQDPEGEGDPVNVYWDEFPQRLVVQFPASERGMPRAVITPLQGKELARLLEKLPEGPIEE